MPQAGIAKFEIISYDVWGNPKDGWEVNNAFHTHQIIEVKIPEETNSNDWEVIKKAYDRLERQLFRKLREAGWIKSGIKRKSVGIEGEYDYTLYFSDERRPPYKEMYGHGRPEFELRRVRD